MDKNEVARRLANDHYLLEDGLVGVYRLRSGTESETDPIKLLEVNQFAGASGVIPVGFRPMPERGITYPTIIVEVTPEEFLRIQSAELALPHGWRLGEIIPKTG